MEKNDKGRRGEKDDNTAPKKRKLTEFEEWFWSPLPDWFFRVSSSAMPSSCSRCNVNDSWCTYVADRDRRRSRKKM